MMLSVTLYMKVNETGTTVHVTVFWALPKRANSKFGGRVYLLSKNLLKKLLFESAFKVGDTSYLQVFPEYRRILKKLF